MALAHRTNYWQNQQPAPRQEDWNSLRNELETLLEQVALRQQSQNPDSPSAPPSHSRPPGNAPAHDRRQQALSSVQQAIERLDEPDEASPMPAHSQKQLQTAIEQIRASQNRSGDRTRLGAGSRAGVHPEPDKARPAANHRQIDELSLSIADFGRRFESLENALGSQENSHAALEDMAGQVEQLSCVELLANSVGERGQIKRLETQIAKLADAVASGSDMDFNTIDQRLDVLSTAFDRLSQLQLDQAKMHERGSESGDTHMQAIQTGVRNIYERLDGMDMAPIEAGVRSVYDRIDALEAGMAVPSPAIERLSRELSDFSKAMRDEKGPVVSSSLVSRVDTLNQRISQIEDSGQPVAALKIDMQELRETVVGAMEPRFAALEDKIGALSSQFARTDEPGLPDISVAELEHQIRILADKMDQTSSELNGLQQLYGEQGAPEPAPDFGAIAELVAKRTTEAVQKAQGEQNIAAHTEAIAELETRLLELFDKNNLTSQTALSRDEQGFLRVQDSIEQVNQRLERLETSLKGEGCVGAAPVADSAQTLGDGQTPAPVSQPAKLRHPALEIEDIAGPDAANRSKTGSGVADEASLAVDNRREEQPTPQHIIPGLRDMMPKAPTDDLPLNAPAFPAPGREERRIPVPHPLRTGPEISLQGETGTAAFEDSVRFDEAARNGIETEARAGAGTGRIRLPQFELENAGLPPAPVSSLGIRSAADNAADPLDADPGQGPANKARGDGEQRQQEMVSRSTFIEAARRAAQKRNPRHKDADGLSLIGRALSRFQKKRAADKPDETEPATAYSQNKPWLQQARQKEAAEKAAVPIALSRKERLEEQEFDHPGIDEDAVKDPGVKNVKTGESFLSKYRQPILLVATLLAVSLLTVNLISQRSFSAASSASAGAAISGESAPPALQQPDQDEAGAGPSPGSSIERPDVKTSAVAGPLERLSDQPDASVRAVEPALIAEMPLTLDLASLASGQIISSAQVLELPPEPVGPMALRQAAAGGDVRAQFEVGAIFAEGRALAQDLGAAARWYQRAAAQGFAPAAYRLGNMYENGVGVDKNLEQARLWYRLGADQGNRMSIHNLASLLAGGALGEQKFGQAAQWFEKAATLGLRDSQFNLGMLYARGLGVTQDLESSFKWFSLAAAQGDEDAEKARQDVARSLDPAIVTRLQSELVNWAPMNLNTTANFAPIGTWTDNFDPGPAIESRDVVLQVQAVLNRIGFDSGEPDGLIGAKTVQAIKAFERAIGMNESGAVNPRLLAVLGSQPV